MNAGVSPAQSTYNLFGDDTTFQGELERRGMLEGYQNSETNRQAVGDHMRRILFLSDMGFSREAIRGDGARIRAAGFLRIENPMDDAAFDAAAKEFAGKRAKEEEANQGAHSAGFFAALEGKSPIDSFQEFAAQRPEQSHERWQLFENYMLGASQIDDLKPVLPLAREIFKLARDNEGLNDEAIAGSSIIKYGELTPEERGKFHEAIALLAEHHGTAADGPMAVFEQMERSFRDMGTRAVSFFRGGASDRQADEILGAKALWFDSAKELSEKERAEFIRRGKVVTKATGNKDKRRGARFTQQLSADELAEAKEIAKLAKGFRLLVEDLPGIRENARKLNQSNTLSGAAGMLATSVPEMVGYVHPVTMFSGAVPNAITRQKAELRERAPELSDEQLNALATSAGTIEAGLGRLQFSTLFKGMPVARAKFQALGRKGLYPALLGAELTQEVIQENSMNFVLTAANLLDKDLPDPRYKETMAALWDMKEEMAIGMLPLIALGAEVQVQVNEQSARELAPLLSDGDTIMASGATSAEADELLGIEDMTARAIRYREIMQGKKPAEVAEQIRNTPAEVMDRAEAVVSAEIFKDDVDIAPQPDGTFEVVETGRTFETAEEAGQAFAEHLQRDVEAERGEAEAARELLEHFEFAHGDKLRTTNKPGREVTMESVLEQGTITRQQFEERVAIEEQRAGQELSRDPGDYLIQGSNRLTKAGRMVIDLNRGRLRPLAAAEEMGEAKAKHDLEHGERDLGFFIENLRAIERQTGKNLLLSENDADLSESDVFEAVGEFVSNYAAGSMQSESLPASFLKWLRAALQEIKQVFRLAGDIAALRMKGELDQDWETWTRRALGMDEEFIMREKEAQVRQEIAQEALGEDVEIQAAIRGRLPRNVAQMAGDPLTGEMESIWSHFKKSGQYRPGKFFAPTSVDRVDLDKVREAMAEKGFPFETIPEMLDAVEASLRGEPTYAGSPETFSMVSRTDPLLQAIDSKLASDESKAAFAEKMLKRVLAVRKRHAERKLDANEDAEQLQVLADLATLQAIGSALPKDIRSKVGSFASLAKKGPRARQNELVRRLGKIDAALTRYLIRDYKERAAKLLNRSLGKKGKDKRRKGSIGVAAHAFAEQAVGAQMLDPDAAQKQAGALEKKFWEEKADLEGDQLEREIWKLDARKRALDLFYDWENATLARVRDAYEELDSEYGHGRQQWIQELSERKALRKKRISQALTLMGAPKDVIAGAPVPREERGKMKETARKISTKAGKAVFDLVHSNHHRLARIVENAKDKKAARAFLNEILDSRIAAEVATEKEQHDTQDAFFEEVARVIGARGPARMHKVRKFIYDAKKQRESRITTIEGIKKSTVEVPVGIAEDILAGTNKGELARSLSEADLDQLQEAWDSYQDLGDAQKRNRQRISFERFASKGKRKELGKISNADALQLWLTLRQEDQAEKGEAMGYDAQTMAELNDFLPEQFKQLGLWMVAHLEKEGKALNAIHEEEYGISLRLHGNYFRVRNEVNGEPLELDQEVSAIQAGITPGAMKERQTNRAEPARVSAFANFLSHTTEMAYWKHNVRWVREWGAVMRDQHFANAMKAYVGEGAYSTLTDYLSTVENHGRRQGDAMMDYERLLKGMLKRYSVGILGMRASTIFVNMTSIMNAFGTDVPARKIVANFAKMWLSPKGEIKATWQNDLQQLRRKYGASFEAAMAQAEDMGSHPIVQSLDKLATYGLAPMNYADVGMGTLTMAALYRSVFDARIKGGMSEAEAREAAQLAVTRAVATVAQPTLSVSKSKLEQKTATSPWIGLFTMFLSEARKNVANNYVAWRTLFTGKGTVDRVTAARQAFLWTALYPAIVMAVREMFRAATKDEEDEEFWTRVTDPNYWVHGIVADQIRPIPALGEMGEIALAEGLDQSAYPKGNPFGDMMRRGIYEIKKAGEDVDDEAGAVERTTEYLNKAKLASVLPGGTILAEAANVGQFLVQFENKSLPSLEALARVAPLKQAEEARKAIYEAHIEELREIRARKEEIGDEPSRVQRRELKMLKKREAEIKESRYSSLQEQYERVKESYPDQWPEVRKKLVDSGLLPQAVNEELDR